MGPFWHDLRHGIRLLIKNPKFSLIAAAMLALGIGGTTAIFSVADGVLLRPLPYPDASRILRAFEVTAKGEDPRWADLNFDDLRRQASEFAGLAEFNSDLEPVAGGSQPVLVTVAAVSRDFFDVIGVHPALGHTFPSEELHAGGTPMVLVSYGFWQRNLGGTQNFASRRLSLSGHLVSVVGVMPAGFAYPDGAQLWFPRELAPTSAYRISHAWLVIGRLRPGIRMAQAQAEVSGIAQRLKQAYGATTDLTDVRLMRLEDQMVGQAEPALLVLVMAVGLLLLAACANVANLLLAQAAGRQRELAVRVAVGASPRRLAGQFMAEALLLTIGGTLLGVPAAILGVRAMVALGSAQLPRAGDVGMHPEVLAFAVAMMLLTAVALGAVTALYASAGSTQESLKGSERTQTGGGSSHTLRMLLMGAQVAVTLVLLVGAVLLGRSLYGLLRAPSGFETSHLLTMDLLDVWPETPAEKTHLIEVLESLVERLGTAHGIESVGVVSALPLTGLNRTGGYLVLDSEQTFTNFQELGQAYLEWRSDPARSGHSEYLVASGGYFRAMGIPLMRGRLFRASDGADAPSVAVVSEAFARKQWPGEDPIGKRIEFGNMDADLRPFTIVGVVGNVHDVSLDSEAVPMLYSCYRQRAANDYSVVMRTAQRPEDMVPVAREIEQSIEPQLPVRFRTMDQIVSASTADRRFTLLLLGVFAVTALFIALIGVYGVGSYLVSQRTKEIGIRMALGARQGDVVRLIAGQGLRVILVGAAVGVLGALGLARALRSLLFGVQSTDPSTFILVLLIVAGAGLLACYLPARRAARVSPVEALREP